jgi:hypothetical protein
MELVDLHVGSPVVRGALSVCRPPRIDGSSGTSGRPGARAGDDPTWGGRRLLVSSAGKPGSFARCDVKLFSK